VSFSILESSLPITLEGSNDTGNIFEDGVGREYTSPGGDETIGTKTNWYNAKLLEIIATDIKIANIILFFL